jgi:hypothetical protein
MRPERQGMCAHSIIQSAAEREGMCAHSIIQSAAEREGICAHSITQSAAVRTRELAHTQHAVCDTLLFVISRSHKMLEHSSFAYMPLVKPAVLDASTRPGPRAAAC